MSAMKRSRGIMVDELRSAAGSGGEPERRRGALAGTPRATRPPPPDGGRTVMITRVVAASWRASIYPADRFTCQGVQNY